MRRRAIAVICPGSDQIGGIDDDGAGNIDRVTPSSIAALHLQPAHIVLEQQRDGAEIRMGAAAELIGRQRRLTDRIVQIAERHVLPVMTVAKEINGQIERQREGFHHNIGAAQAFVEKPRRRIQKIR